MYNHSITAATALVVLLAGCADTHQLLRTGGQLAKLPAGSSAYVAIPNDGRYGSRLYAGSGALTAQLIATAITPCFSRVAVGLKNEDAGIARQSAQTAGATHLVLPDILQWEDRATEWSARPDVASVRISVIQVDGGTILDNVVVSGKSGLATFGGDRPEHLLPKPLEEYANSLCPK